MLTCLLALLIPAHAARDRVAIANDVVRDGIVGVELRLAGAEAVVLDRQDLRLDPARHKVYPALVDAAGRRVYVGRRPPGAGPGVAQSTTTPALPADDGEHVFFVPYHRLELPAGEHRLRAVLELDTAGAGIVEVVQGEVVVRMPELEWAVLGLEQPPGPDPRQWRVRLGQDVLAQRSQGPAVVVLSPADTVKLDVRTADAARPWTFASRRVLEQEARRLGLGPRALRVSLARRMPPLVVDSQVDTRIADAGLELDARWTLRGQAMDGLIPLDARPYLADPGGTRWSLPHEVRSRTFQSASLLVPEWGLPSSLDPARPWRVGWEVVAVADASPLTRDLVLGRAEHPLTSAGALHRMPLSARLVEARTDDADGLTAVVDVAWSLPPGMAPLGEARLSGSWEDRDGWPVDGLWTPCAETGAPNTCAEAWGRGPLSHPHGMSRLSLPWAWVVSTSGRGTPLHVRVGLDGRRPLHATLVLPEHGRPVHLVRLQPKKAELACQDGEQVRWVWVAAGRELASTPARPCRDGRVRWSREDAVSLPALGGDRLELGLQIGERSLRRVPVRIAHKPRVPELAEPSAGIEKARFKLTIDRD